MATTGCAERWQIVAVNRSPDERLVRLTDSSVRVFRLPGHASLVVDDGWGGFYGLVDVLAGDCAVVGGAQTKGQKVVVSIDAAGQAFVDADSGLAEPSTSGRAERVDQCRALAA